MRDLLRRLPLVLVILAAIFLGTNIARSVFAQPATVPRDADRTHTGRTVAADAGVDDRLAIPAGQWVGGNGVIEPADRETRVAAQTGGRIARIAVHEGDFVEANAVLVELEASSERAALAAAQADMDASAADLSRVAHGNRAEDIQAAQAEAESGAARARLSADILARDQTLVPSGAITPDELDRARRQADSDRFTAAQLDARRRASMAGSRREDIAVARARYEATIARRDQARATLDLRTVRAPIAGEVLQVKYRAGEYYQPGGAGDPLVVMGDTRQLRVRMDVDERDVGLVQTGATALVRALAYPGVDYTARVVEIARRMGRKNVRTDDPVERNDTKILEVVLVLEAPRGLVVGQRVVSFIARPPAERRP